MQAAPTPGDTYVNVTLQFVDSCNKDKPTKLTIQGLVRQCEAGGQAQDPLLQPWQADSVKVAVQAVPPNCECAAFARCLVLCSWHNSAVACCALSVALLHWWHSVLALPQWQGDALPCRAAPQWGCGRSVS